MPTTREIAAASATDVPPNFRTRIIRLLKKESVPKRKKPAGTASGGFRMCACGSKENLMS
jgi:hypothetical protein